MAVGKYSPTVRAAYLMDQDWWKPEHEYSQVDKDGYDSYGYDLNGVDRAGIHESQYLVGEWIGDSYEYPLYEEISSIWEVDEGGCPALISHKNNIDLTPMDFEYLDILQEECAEVIQIISKIKRFGLYSNFTGKTNQQLLVEEVGDVYALIQYLEEKKVFSRWDIEARARVKQQKIKKFLRTK
jgi:NTP pyrophosphatase (non-canonical NTP hydrolase)